MFHILIQTVLVLAYHSGASANTKCFECQNMQLPSECTRLTTCSSGQVCFVETVSSGSSPIHYNSGCRKPTGCSAPGVELIGRRSTDVLCTECCADDYCNAYGCQSLEKECFKKINLGYFYDSTSDTCSSVVKAIGQTFDQSEADTNCHSQGANIVTINTDAEQQFLLSGIYTHYRNTIDYWIGLNANTSGSHKYHWSSGQTLAYTNWGTTMTGQPTDVINGSENCVYMKSRDNFNWYDGNCTMPKTGFVCEILTENTINSTDFWIGAMDRQDTSTFTWPDGTAVNYASWGGPEFPAPSHSQPDEQFYNKYNQGCVYLSSTVNGEWYDEKCDMLKHGYICQYQGATEKDTETGCFSRLGNGYFFDYRTKLCVSIVNGEPHSRDRAQVECMQFNSSLVEIVSQSSSQFILNLIYSLRENVTDYWIGGKDLYKNGHFYWGTDRPFNYTNWHLVISQVPDDCMILDHTDNFRWYPQQCSARKQGYICEVDKQTVIQNSISNYLRLQTTTPSLTTSTATTRPTTETTTHGRTLSPDGYFDIAKSSLTSVCIKLYTSHLTYSDAINVCKRDGATLVFPNSAAIMNDIKTYMSDTHRGIASFYIGLLSLAGDGVFTSVDGYQVLYTNWMNGEPSQHDECARANLMADYRWQAIKCSYSLPFMCQKHQGC